MMTKMVRDFEVLVDDLPPKQMEDMKIPEYKFLLNDGLGDEFLPTKSEPDATGWDVRSTIDLTLKPGEYFKIPLGFRAFSPPGWWFQLHPRSSFFAKKYMHNLIGIIDEAYSDEVLLAGQYLPVEFEKLNNSMDRKIERNSLICEIKIGDRIGQIIPIERQEMVVTKVAQQEFDDLCKQRAAKRSGGFGSSGDR